MSIFWQNELIILRTLKACYIALKTCYLDQGGILWVVISLQQLYASIHEEYRLDMNVKCRLISIGYDLCNMCVYVPR